MSVSAFHSSRHPLAGARVVACAAFAGVVGFARGAAAADIKVACVGDSITQGSGSTNNGDYPTVLDGLLGAGWDARNFGNSGKTMIKAPSDGASYWAQTQYTQSRSFAPDIVVIMLGTNDAKTANWKSGSNTYAADYKEMVNVYLALPSKPKVYAMFPPPALSSSFTISSAVIQNEIIPIIKSVAAQTGIGTIDLNSAFSAHDPKSMMGSDGIHPNNTGYAFIAQTVASALMADRTDAGTPTNDAGARDAAPLDAAARDAGKLDASSGSDVEHAVDGQVPDADPVSNAGPEAGSEREASAPNRDPIVPDGGSGGRAGADPSSDGSSTNAGQGGAAPPAPGAGDTGCSCTVGGRDSNETKADWALGWLAAAGWVIGRRGRRSRARCDRAHGAASTSPGWNRES